MVTTWLNSWQIANGEIQSLFALTHDAGALVVCSSNSAIGSAHQEFSAERSLLQICTMAHHRQHRDTEAFPQWSQGWQNVIKL